MKISDLNSKRDWEGVIIVLISRYKLYTLVDVGD